eukprot:GHVU01037007.1.p1 GENE.GHVU01037007.1~~GHVU01037007.1.p1  ORF type:complete len:503 (+),score=68.90 GHVU01037007.1:142-1650(+)
MSRRARGGESGQLQYHPVQTAAGRNRHAASTAIFVPAILSPLLLLLVVLVVLLAHDDRGMCGAFRVGIGEEVARPRPHGRHLHLQQRRPRLALGGVTAAEVGADTDDDGKEDGGNAGKGQKSTAAEHAEHLKYVNRVFLTNVDPRFPQVPTRREFEGLVVPPDMSASFRRDWETIQAQPGAREEEEEEEEGGERADTAADSAADLECVGGDADTTFSKVVRMTRGLTAREKPNVSPSQDRLLELLSNRSRDDEVLSLVDNSTMRGFLNFSRADVMMMARRDIKILGRPPAQLEAVGRCLSDYGWTPEEVRRIVLRTPRLTRSLNGTRNRLETLEELGLGREGVLRAGRTSPQVLGVSSMNAKKKFNEFYRFTHIGKYKNDNWTALTEDECRECVARCPRLLTFNMHRSVLYKMVFLFNDMKKSAADLKTFPQYLFYNYSRKIYPRYYALTQVKGRRAEELPSLMHMLACSDETFIGRFQVGYREWISSIRKGRLAYHPQQHF